MTNYLQAQYECGSINESITYQSGETIQFNKILSDSQPMPVFDIQSGTMIFEEAGIYKIDWSVNVLVTSASIPSTFSIITSHGDRRSADTNQRMGTVTGSAILTIDQPGTTAALVHESVGEVRLGGSLLIANLTVYSLDDETPETRIAALGMEMTLVSDHTVQLSGDEGIRFNHITLSENPNILYREETGEFVLLQPGGYQINWWINLEYASKVPGSNPLISLAVNGVPYSSLPSEPGAGGHMISGTTFIRVMEADTVIKIMNGAPGTVIILGSHQLRAGISIVQWS